VARVAVVAGGQALARAQLQRAAIGVDEDLAETWARRPHRGHQILAMRVHLPAYDHDVMDVAPALYQIRINGHLGATVLSAFPTMVSQREQALTVLTGLLDRSALYGVLAEIETLGLDLVDVRRLAPGPPPPPPDETGPS
jgi:hypothetical protein